MITRTNIAVWMENQKCWQIQVQMDEMRRTFYSSTEGAAGKRECQAKAFAFLRTGVAPTNRRVETVIAEWLETLKPTRNMQSSANYVQYESITRMRATRQSGASGFRTSATATFSGSSTRLRGKGWQKEYDAEHSRMLRRVLQVCT